MTVTTLAADRRNVLVLVGIAVAIMASAVLALSLDNGLAFSVSLALLAILIVSILQPRFVFYLFMLFFVFGEVGFGEYVVQISFSNFFTILALVVLLVHGLIGRRSFRSAFNASAIKPFWVWLSLLSLWELVSACLNQSYRPLMTSVSHVVSVLVVVLLVRDKNTLFKGFVLGILSIGMLSSLTILRGLNLSEIGYRATASWGSAPWERYVPRAIGLPNMQGGLHSTYILAFLPLAAVLSANLYRLRISIAVRVLSSIVLVLGLLALMIALYRSGWLGTLASMVCLVWLAYRTLRVRPQYKVLGTTTVLALSSFLLLQFGAAIYYAASNLLLNVRAQGVDARLVQNQFVLGRMISPSIHQLFGYGYENFGAAFMDYVWRANLNNPELYPWLHNYFLDILYGIGWVGLIVFLCLIGYVLRILYLQSKSNDPLERTLGVAMFASFSGIMVVLAFTAETSGLHILWILMGGALILQGSKRPRPFP